MLKDYPGMKTIPFVITKVVCIYFFGFVFLTKAQAQEVYIHCGRLFDCTNEQLQQNMTIVVEGNQIKSIQRGFIKPQATSEAKIVDLSTHTVMPGLMDMHVHVESESSPSSYLENFTLSDADRAFRSQMFAMRNLMAGFTTLRDLGGSGVNVALRNAINQGTVKGPRIYTAEKSIATTGGHADPSNGRRKELALDPGPELGVINSPEEARKAVRQRYKNGADCIKITATGGVLSVAASGLNPQFMEDELAAIIATAKDYGFHTAAHAHGTEGMKRAVLAGITSIEHGTYMTEEVAELMKTHGTYYVPTISAGKFVAGKAKIAGFYPRMVAQKALEIGPQIQNTFAMAYKKGVLIAFGTDTGVSLHGDNADEFIFMVEAGMSPAEAILSATVTSAKLLNISDKLGTIEVGKSADIIAVEGNPLQDIQSMKKVAFVMKDGEVFKAPSE